MQSIIDFFIRNKVAANLLMFSILLLGFLSTMQNRTEFFPKLDITVVVASVSWSNSSPSDVSKYIIEPLKAGFTSLERIKNVNATAYRNGAGFTFEFKQGTDMQKALQDVEKLFVQYRGSLPSQMDEAIIQQAAFTQDIMKLVITSDASVEELVPLIRQYERELIDLGVFNIGITGLPKKEILIEVDQLELRRLGLTLQSVYNSISRDNFDVSLGVVGSSDQPYNLRITENKRSIESLSNIVVRKSQDSIILLRDVAKVYVSYESLDQERFLYKNKPAILFEILGPENVDVVKISKKIVKWFEKTKFQAPESVDLQLIDESWKFVKDRVDLVLKNALSGLLLVMLVLLLFVNQKIAFWVMMGAVTAFSGSLFILYYLNQTINMISLFGFVLATGMVVDDAIVVAEQIYYRHIKGATPFNAASVGVQRMYKAIVASTMTTVGAFLPLMFIGDVMGQILKVLPLVVIAVLFVSLIESFFILPHHLKTGLSRSEKNKNPSACDQSQLLQKERAWFVWVREKFFSPAIHAFTRHPFITFGLLLIVFGFSIVGAKKIPFIFFPSPEGNIIVGNVSLLPSVSLEKRKQAEKIVHEVFEEFQQKQENKKLLEHYYLVSNQQNISIFIELQDVSERKQRLFKVRNLIEEMAKQRFEKLPYIENFYLNEQTGGPPGSEISVDLKGDDIYELKEAALELQEQLSLIPGVYGLRDNTPYGRQDLILNLNDYADRLGLSMSDINYQLNLGFSGRKIDEFTQDRNTVRINFQIPEKNINNINDLYNYQIRLNSGETVLLKDVAEFKYANSVPAIKSLNGNTSIRVEGSVDFKLITGNQVTKLIQNKLGPELKLKYPSVYYDFSGTQTDQAATIKDMQYGAILGLALIYIVLALMFGRYTTPFLILATIPVLWIGVAFVYLLLKFEFTLLTIFGVFGLLGVAVNNCIIWVDLYYEMRKKYESVEAAARTSLLRLRPILCTSMTTVIGLTPLLFETSLQAQFLKPMVLVIVGGLAFSIILVLCFLPSLFLIIESIKRFFSRLLGP